MMFYFSCRLAEEIARTKLHSPNVYNLGHRDSIIAAHEVGDYNVHSTLRLTEVTYVHNINASWLPYVYILNLMPVFT
jgi:hypothetical protein